MNILVTGGAGYIGSHTCVELLMAGHEVIVIDNLANSRALVFDRIERICGRRPVFHQQDVRDSGKVAEILSNHKVDAVIHFAGLKAVGESVAQPLWYYDNNVTGSLSLLRAMKETGVRAIVFSSSATVYGDPQSVPIREDAPLSATNPYGRSKLMVEDILRDLHVSDPLWQIARLRYFNPVGAHESGLIGELPHGIPNNLMPYLTQVAVGKLPVLSVFGSDYPTADGTGVRDYIHVVDLALGHLKVLDKLKARPGLVTYNLGTGRGYTVLEMVAAFEKTCGRKIPYRMVGRRPGDIAACYADPSLAKKEFGWVAERSLDQMCADSWRWQLRAEAEEEGAT